jgi:hypothetical protein
MYIINFGIYFFGFCWAIKFSLLSSSSPPLNSAKPLSPTPFTIVWFVCLFDWLVFYVSILCEFFFFLFMILELHIWFLCVWFWICANFLCVCVWFDLNIVWFHSGIWLELILICIWNVTWTLYYLSAFEFLFWS